VLWQVVSPHMLTLLSMLLRFSQVQAGGVQPDVDNALHAAQVSHALADDFWHQTQPILQKNML